MRLLLLLLLQLPLLLLLLLQKVFENKFYENTYRYREIVFDCVYFLLLLLLCVLPFALRTLLNLDVFGWENKNQNVGFCCQRMFAKVLHTLSCPLHTDQIDDRKRERDSERERVNEKKVSKYTLTNTTMQCDVNIQTQSLTRPQLNKTKREKHRIFDFYFPSSRARKVNECVYVCPMLILM